MSDLKDNFSFIWKIENFSMLPLQPGESLVSQTFVIDTLKNVDFTLQFYKEYSIEEGISLFLCKIPKSLGLRLDFSFTIEATEPSKEVKMSIKNHILLEDWGFTTSVHLGEFYDDKQFYLPHDTLTIRCDLNPSMEISLTRELNFAGKLRKSCVCHTCIEVQRKSIMWSIENIKERIIRKGKVSYALASPLADVSCLELSLSFNRISSDNCINILIKQTRLSSIMERLFVRCKITLVSVHAECSVFEESSHLFELDTSDDWSIE